MLYSRYFSTDKPHWINGSPSALQPHVPFDCLFRFQHSYPLTKCRLVLSEDDHLEVETEEPHKALAVGQYAVFYTGNVCLGSASITHVGPTEYQLQHAENSQHASAAESWQVSSKFRLLLSLWYSSVASIVYGNWEERGGFNPLIESFFPKVKSREYCSNCWTFLVHKMFINAVYLWELLWSSVSFFLSLHYLGTWCLSLPIPNTLELSPRWITATEYFAQLMPLPLTISCSSKSRFVLPSWFYLSGTGSPW